MRKKIPERVTEKAPVTWRLSAEFAIDTIFSFFMIMYFLSKVWCLDPEKISLDVKTEEEEEDKFLVNF